MTFPHALWGVKKIFIAELVSLVAAVILAAGIAVENVAVVIGGAEAVVNAPLSTAMGAADALIITAAALFVIAFVIELVGLARAGRDEDSFKIGFWVVTAALVVLVAFTLISRRTPHLDLDELGRIISGFAVVHALIYIVEGVTDLAKLLSVQNMVSMGKKYKGVISVLHVISIVSALTPAILGEEKLPITLSSVFEIGAEVIMIAVDVMVLHFLSKAKRMLSTH